MQLAEWIDSNNIALGEFAEKIGISRQALYNLLRRTSSPSLKTALAIQRASGGKVPLKVWANGGRK